MERERVRGEIRERGVEREGRGRLERGVERERGVRERGVERESGGG